MTQLLVEGTVRGTIPLLAAVPIAWLLRARPATVRHDIWFLALVSAVLMFILPSVLPVVEMRIPASAMLVPTVEYAEQAPLLGGVRGVNVLALLWALPALQLLGLTMVSLARVHRWVGMAVDVPGVHPAHDLAYSLCAPRRMPLLVSDHVRVPFAWGIFRPCIVLPRAALTWSQEDLRSTLVHEVAHISRRDPLMRFVTETICCLLWYHPLAWICAWRVREEAEAACDRAVVADGRRRSDYARQLLRLNQEIACSRLLSALGGTGAMRRRLEKLLHEQVVGPVSNTARYSIATGWLALTIASAVSTPEVASTAAGPDPTTGIAPQFHTVQPPSDEEPTEHIGSEGDVVTGQEVPTEVRADVHLDTSRQVILEITREVDIEVTRQVNLEITREVNFDVTRDIHSHVVRESDVDRRPKTSRQTPTL